MHDTSRSLTVFAVTSLALILAACGGEGQVEDAPQAVGADADEHGCRASAGYQWCEATQQCERPWELAEAEGFENSPEAFAAFCGEGEGEGKED